jgi:hypothetical protein
MLFGMDDKLFFTLEFSCQEAKGFHLHVSLIQNPTPILVIGSDRKWLFRGFPISGAVDSVKVISGHFCADSMTRTTAMIR